METKVIDAEKKLGSISVFGDLDGSTSPTLLKEIEEMIGQGTTNIILDFTEIEFISSSGIGVIAVSSKDISQRQGKLIVVCSNKKVLSLFDITNLSKVITVFKTMDEALAAV
ncbi:MAG: STAS domain-containing protein [SAR324 cluster bacterium]|nr:STAS domain-containing protein [SAR324 cluster bacterium]